MIHLKSNLIQAARFSMRIENKTAAEDALTGIEKGILKTRGQVDEFIERRKLEVLQAMDKVQEQRECLTKQ